MAHKKLIIFDFDGTLVDSSRVHQDAFNEAFFSLGIKVDYSRHAGVKTLDAVISILAENGITQSPDECLRIVATKQAAVARAYNQSIELMPGIAQFLNWATGRGILMSIGTSGSRRNVTAALDKLKIIHLFPHIVTADEVAHGKPYPETFLKILSLSSIPATHSIVIEDSLSGVQAAQNADLDVICIDPTVKLLHSNHDGVEYAPISDLTALISNH